MTRFSGARYETQLKNILIKKGYRIKNLAQNEAGDLLVLTGHGISIIEVKSTVQDRFYYTEDYQLNELKKDAKYAHVYIVVRFLRRKWKAYELAERVYRYEDGFTLEDLFKRL